METVGAFDAKTHLSSLLEKVARGEKFTITRHGIPVAMLVPAPAQDKADTAAVIKQIKKLRKGVSLGNDSLRALIDSARKY